MLLVSKFESSTVMQQCLFPSLACFSTSRAQVFCKMLKVGAVEKQKDLFVNPIPPYLSLLQPYNALLLCVNLFDDETVSMPNLYGVSRMFLSIFYSTPSGFTWSAVTKFPSPTRNNNIKAFIQHQRWSLSTQMKAHEGC